MKRRSLELFDALVIKLFRRYSDAFARVVLFIIFFWFGILKIFMVSPANPLVVQLLDATFLHVIPSDLFLIVWGLFEMVIGVLILIPRLERITFAILLFHLFTTVMPLYLLPDVTWMAPFVPTLIGQYIVKNLALLSISLFLFARLTPMTTTHSILERRRRLSQ